MIILYSKTADQKAAKEYLVELKEGWRTDEIGENPTPDIGDIPYLEAE